MSKGKYDRDVVIRKLEKKGLKVKYVKGNKAISHFEAPPYGVDLGIKMLGYLDFIGVPVIKKTERERDERKERSKNDPKR